jgi:transcriptional regulator with XRE-family HTH domain
MEINTIGDKIKKMRLRKNMTQKELAHELAVSTSAISNWETGRRLPSIDELKRIANHFQRSLSYFDIDEQTVDAIDRKTYQNELQQTVLCQPLGYQTKRLNKVFFILAAFILLLSFLFDFLLDLVILFVGLFCMIYAIVCFFLQRIKQTLINTKRVLIPISQTVMYIHTKEKSDIRRYRKKVLIALFSLLSLSLITFVIITLAFYPFNYVYFDILIAIYALVIVLVSLYRYSSVQKSPIFDKRVDYYAVNRNLKHYSLTIGFVLDAVTFIIVTSLLVIFRSFYEINILTFLIVFLPFLEVILSYLVLTDYKRFIHGFYLYSIDEEGEKYALLRHLKG